MLHFDDKQQDKKIAELHNREEEELARILSSKYGFGYVDLSNVSISTEALQLVNEKEAQNALLAPFARVGKKISVGIKSPNKDETRAILNRLKERGYIVTLFMVSTKSLERAWSHYRDISSAIETKSGLLDISNEDIQKTISEITTLDEAREKIDEILGKKKAYRISSILEIILSGALSQKASDIHVEPEETYVRLRFRLDGVLTDILRFDRETYGLLLSRIKLLSGLKLNIKNAAQDGRFSIRIDQSDIEIRTSILPGAYGESIVLRVLDPSTIAISLEELGIPQKLQARIAFELKKPNGMILNTGPTGAGKITTLYSFLKSVHSTNIKIVTIEDPIEYHLPGIVQTQVSEDYSFSQGLRSALRQDPDIIMIGEIRDSDVAETAINSALTGHLVFSTLHTNDAAGAFPRLVDLGVNASIISSAVNIVMAQRLVRRLKPNCRKKIPLEGSDKERVERTLASITDKSLIPKNTTFTWEPSVEGESCEVPYGGRVGLFEAIFIDEAIEKQIEMNASAHEIKKEATQQGMLTIEQDGILKVLLGITSLSEIDRVLSIEVAKPPLVEEASSLGKKKIWEEE